jgi:hypothetical protein
MAKNLPFRVSGRVILLKERTKQAQYALANGLNVSFYAGW